MTTRAKQTGDLVHGPTTKGYHFTVCVVHSDGSASVLAARTDADDAATEFASSFRKPQGGQVVLARSGRVIATCPQQVGR